MSDFDELQKVVSDFLAKGVKVDDSGWAPVSSEDRHALGAIIEMLIELKWQKDADGDLPMEFTLTDRTRSPGNHFYELPYWHDIKNWNRVWELVVMNVSIASDDLRLYRDLKRSHDERISNGEAN